MTRRIDKEKERIVTRGAGRMDFVAKPGDVPTSRRRGLSIALAVALALALFAALPFAAGAQAPSSLSYESCLSSNTEVTACDLLADATPAGADSPLDGTNHTVVSPDGLHVYATAPSSAAIAHFDRDPSDGSLVYAGCYSTDSSLSSACDLVTGVTPQGVGSPLRTVSGLVMSQDGEHLYALGATAQGAVTHFSRDAVTGAITRESCRSGSTEVSACTPVTGATESGAGTAIRHMRRGVVSSDRAHLYVVSTTSDSIAHFSLVASSGVPVYQGCISGNTDVVGCEHVDGAGPGGSGTGLDNARDVAMSHDGSSIYVTSQNDDAVTIFERDVATGELEHAGCLTSDSDVEVCEQVPDAAPGGSNSSLNGAEGVALSPGGEHVYVGSQIADSITLFDRVLSTGALDRRGCISSNSNVSGCSMLEGATSHGAGTGLNGVVGLVMSADGLSLHVVAPGSHAVAAFARHAPTGTLIYEGCLTSANNVGGCEKVPGATATGASSPLRTIGSLSISPDGSSLYSTSNQSDAVGHLSRLAPPPPEAPGEPTEPEGGGDPDPSDPAPSDPAPSHPPDTDPGEEQPGEQADDGSQAQTADTSVHLGLPGKRLRMNRRGVIRARVACPASEASPPCEGAVGVRTQRRVPVGKGGKRKRVRLGRGRFEAGAGETVVVRMRLNRRAVQLVRGVPQARRVETVARVDDQAGNRARVGKRMRLSIGR